MLTKIHDVTCRHQATKRRNDVLDPGYIKCALAAKVNRGVSGFANGYTLWLGVIICSFARPTPRDPSKSLQPPLGAFPYHYHSGTKVTHEGKVNIHRLQTTTRSTTRAQTYATPIIWRAWNYSGIQMVTRNIPICYQLFLYRIRPFWKKMRIRFYIFPWCC